MGKQQSARRTTHKIATDNLVPSGVVMLRITSKTLIASLIQYLQEFGADLIRGTEAP